MQAFRMTSPSAQAQRGPRWYKLCHLVSRQPSPPPQDQDVPRHSPICTASQICSLCPVPASFQHCNDLPQHNKPQRSDTLQKQANITLKQVKIIPNPSLHIDVPSSDECSVSSYVPNIVYNNNANDNAKKKKHGQYVRHA